ncbi:styrene monooxygenase/indole monooxygenase family protein [Deinococcus hopiensis]|uniref:2-polyprenyl-6-methoxyphenol hydroxylase n=1 Tax=Deinococcus hopiensis KR-140 TaxID=695939 RepID=A0A1W1VV53_9DEIO|nr:styrene monooxygenase/indole monooxygenase family protein [Deinococcus hopiensis]SMB97238.1 2-polyprenyl-6-methoxyphenol hydroxylase [Deinococcus hopiensis KR-140]
MRKIAIVGAGQAGLQLALGLQDQGYTVTLVSERTPEQIETGRVMSTQALFHDACLTERQLNLNFWEEMCPPVEGIAFSVPHPDLNGDKAVAFAARLDHPAYSVDQRVKFAGWLRVFKERGGTVILEQADVQSVDQLSEGHDLTVIATGKGELGRLFARDDVHSPYRAPQRHLALAYLKNTVPRPEHSAVSFNLIPGAGECFLLPGLTRSPDGSLQPYENVLIEAVPGGPLDVFENITSPDELLSTMLQLMQTFCPWEYERIKDGELTDPQATLTGRVTPQVRRPVAALPSGRLVLGLGDTLVVNDPITGQGAGSAARAAATYLESILRRAERPFNRSWMQDTFGAYWDHARFTTAWTNAMLGPPPPHVLAVLTAAQTQPGVAHAFVNAFNHPPHFFPWLTSPEEAAAFVDRHSTSA